MERRTKKVSCQHPIMEIFDMSANHTDNANENSWMVTKTFPTAAEIEADETVEKTYEAELWSRVNEELTFKVKFNAGSHMRVEWGLDATDPVSGIDEADICHIKTMADVSYYSSPSKFCHKVIG